MKEGPSKSRRRYLRELRSCVPDPTCPTADDVEQMFKESAKSFGLVVGLGASRLRTSRNRVARRCVLVRAMRLEVLVVVVTIRVVVSVRSAIMMHLLRAGSKLLMWRISTHGHCELSACLHLTT